jgi:excisionase family DNA binding protein
MEHLHTDDLAKLVDALRSRSRSRSPWLTAPEAAYYVRCPVSRLRKLTMTRELPCHRDGRRTLFHRDERPGCGVGACCGSSAR